MTATRRLLAQLRQRPYDEGSGAITLILYALLFMVIAGFLVDGGLAIHQRERAADIAEQAARYAANHVQSATLRADGTVTVEGNPACTGYVQDFVRQSGLTGADVTSSDCIAAVGNTVSVEVRIRYQPVLLSLLSGSRLTVWGRATAQAVQEQ